MEGTVLVVTVGGSCEPIVNAVKETSPQFVYFLCSTGPRGSETVVDGEGKPCDNRDGEGRPSIVQQTSLSPDRYAKVPLEDPDDIDGCFEKILELAKSIQQRFPNAQVVANYTGGTKTMSVALAVAAVYKGWDLRLNRGTRANLQTVEPGTDVPVRVRIGKVLAEHYEHLARLCIDMYDYAGAASILSQALQTANLDSREQQRLVTLRSYCTAFESWDRFEYSRAADLLGKLRGELAGKYLPALRVLQKEDLAESGYMRVHDLLLNAERRCVQRRFDDAVARLYRALELLAQTRLRTAHGINTSDVDISKLPEHLRTKYSSDKRHSKDKIQLALVDAYELLCDLDDPVGTVYNEIKSQLLDVLRERNYSYLAHGTKPVAEEGYIKVNEVLTNFVEQTISQAHLPRIQRVVQLPQSDGFRAFWNE